MTRPSHTPGPWARQRNGARLNIVPAGPAQAPPRPYIATINPQDTSATTDANAALIAAAPELLAELRDAVLMLNDLADKGRMNPNAASMYRKHALLAAAQGLPIP